MINAENTTVCKKDSCVGCMACVAVCPKQAIIIQDDLTAYNAIIDKSKCVQCGQCYKICQNNQHSELLKPIKWWQGWIKEEALRKKSSSGGIATAIEYGFIKSGGVVCSCEYTEGTFCFSFAEKEKEVEKFCGSKYIKSNPKEVYKEVKYKLINNQKVLFVGLPCQVAAIKNYVGERLQKQLYTVDLVCHGTPSPQLLRYFLKQYNLEIKNIDKIQFRTKTRFQLKENDKYIGTGGTLDKYSMAFLNSISYTENCYSCTYARKERISDITLGDSWGSELSQEEQAKGISLILCQTEKGIELIEKADIEKFDVDIEKAIQFNHQLSHPSIAPKRKEFFFNSLKKGKSFNQIVTICYPIQSLKQLIKKILIKVGVT